MRPSTSSTTLLVLGIHGFLLLALAFFSPHLPTKREKLIVQMVTCDATTLDPAEPALEQALSEFLDALPPPPAEEEEIAEAPQEEPEPMEAAEEIVQETPPPPPPPKPVVKKEVKKKEPPKPKPQPKPVKAPPKKETPKPSVKKKTVETKKKKSETAPVKIAKKTTSSPTPKKTEKKSSANPELISLMQKSLSQLEGGSGKGQKSMGASSAPKVIGSLGSEGIKAPPKGLSYEEELVIALRAKLQLPEWGDVKLKLALSAAGNVISVTVTSASDENRTYIEKRVPTLHFAPFGTHFSGEKTHTFSLTLKGER